MSISMSRSGSTILAAALLLAAASRVQAVPADCYTNDNLPYVSERIGTQVDANACHWYDSRTGDHTLMSTGNDIWGNADDFVFGALPMSGDIAVVAQVTNQVNTNGFAKAGVMIRAGLAANSRNASMVITPSNGALFQSRLTDGGATTNTASAGPKAPYWVKIEKRANSVKGFRSPDGITWTQVGGTVTLDAGNSFYVGVASTSRVPGSTSQSNFSNFTVVPLGSAGLVSKAIGNPGKYGTLAESGGTYTQKASGADITGSTDQFEFACQKTSGDKVIIARVASQQNTNATAKAGIMVRETLDPFSPNFFLSVTPTSGLRYQLRSLSGGVTASSTTAGIAAPYWLKIEKRGTYLAAYRSTDGAAWTQVGALASIPLGKTYYVGLAATSRDNNTLGTVTYTNVSIANLESDGFVSAHIGGNTLGSYARSAAGGTHTLVSGGADIFGTSDQFRFAHEKRKGDQTLIAKVATLQNTNAWAKAGLMMRTGLMAGSRNVFLGVTPTSGIVFQKREREGDVTTNQVTAGFPAPHWLKLEKRGSTIRGYRATDGINWTLVGTYAINLGTECFMGLAATSHAGTTTGTSTFTDVLVVPAPSLVAVPYGEIGWSSSMGQFAMDQTEVTEEEFLATMVNKWGTAARGGRRGSLKPIANVTLADALLYANARSERDGLPVAYRFSQNGNNIPPNQSPCATGTPGNNCGLGGSTYVSYDESSNGYRIPDDEQWRYAATLVLNGPFKPNPGRYPWSLTETSETGSANVGRYAVWNTTASAVVGSKWPGQEGLALFDLSGNVAEWTYFSVAMGGSWGSTSAAQLALDASPQMAPNFRDTKTGFRCIMPLIRKDAQTLSKLERERFLNAIFTLKNTRFPGYATAVAEASRLFWWDWFVVTHRLTMSPDWYDAATGQWNMTSDLAHGGPAFLPWHRQFLDDMEEALQTVDARVTMPFIRWGYGGWDQADESVAMPGMQDAFAPYNPTTGKGLLGFQLNYDEAPVRERGIFDPDYPASHAASMPLWWPLGELGPLGGWKVPVYTDLDDSYGYLLRMMWGGDGVTHEMATILDYQDYDSFRAGLEQGPHNDFHSRTGGQMGDPMTSPIDPVFWLHHAEVDRQWSLWLARNPSRTPDTYGYADPIGAMGQDRPDPVWPHSGSFYRPMSHMTGNLPSPYPTLPVTLRNADVLNHKGARYLNFAP